MSAAEPECHVVGEDDTIATIAYKYGMRYFALL